MTQTQQAMEYECPCCGAALIFGSDSQQMTCQYCDNTFDLETVQAYRDSKSAPIPMEERWDTVDNGQWTQEEQASVKTYTCQSCGGELITDDQTAATFCPYCGNPTILPGRLSGGVKPDAVIPFRRSKEDAQKAFLELCKGKPPASQGFYGKAPAGKDHGYLCAILALRM